MKTKQRQKTANIKKCIGQMCEGKKKKLHYDIGDNYKTKRGHKKQGK